MKEFTYTVKDPIGIHARPAGLLVRKASAFSSEVSLECGGKTADAKRLFSIMGLGVKSGDTITVKIEGKDETEAAELLRKFLEENL